MYGDIDEARENADNAYLDKRAREGEEAEAEEKQERSRNIEEITDSICDTLDDILYYIKHHNKKGVSDSLDKIANFDMDYTDDDVVVPDGVSLNDDFADFIDGFDDPINKKDFEQSVKVLKQYKHTYDKEYNSLGGTVDSSLFLQSDY